MSASYGTKNLQLHYSNVTWKLSSSGLPTMFKFITMFILCDFAGLRVVIPVWYSCNSYCAMLIIFKDLSFHSDFRLYSDLILLEFIFSNVFFSTCIYLFIY